MALDPSGVPSRAGIQAAINDAVAVVAAATAALAAKSQPGKTIVTIPAGSASSTPLAVTFSPAFPAGTTPRVALTPNTTTPYSATLNGDPTNTGFAIIAHRPPGASTAAAANVGVHWIATIA